MTQHERLQQPERNQLCQLQTWSPMCCCSAPAPPPDASAQPPTPKSPPQESLTARPSPPASAPRAASRAPSAAAAASRYDCWTGATGPPGCGGQLPRASRHAAFSARRFTTCMAPSAASHKGNLNFLPHPAPGRCRRHCCTSSGKASALLSLTSPQPHPRRQAAPHRSQTHVTESRQTPTQPSNVHSRNPGP